MKRMLLLMYFFMAGQCVGNGACLSNSLFRFDVVATNLNASTFQVTLSICTQIGRYYGFEYHEGPPGGAQTNWNVITCLTGTGGEVQVLDPASLSVSGRTYRAIAPWAACETHPNNIVSVNEEFVAYPFFTNPTLRVAGSLTNDEELAISYGEGLYSNVQHYAVSSTQESRNANAPNSGNGRGENRS